MIKNNIFRNYIKHRHKFFLGCLCLSTVAIIILIFISAFDIFRLNNEKLIDRHISNIESRFEVFCIDFYANQDIGHTNLLSHIDYFEENNSTLILLKKDSIVFMSENICETYDEIFKAIHNVKTSVNIGGREVVPLVVKQDINTIVLLVTITTTYENLVSRNISAKIKMTVNQLLLYISFVILIFSLRSIIIKHVRDIHKTIKLYLLFFILTSILIFCIYTFEIEYNILYFIGIQLMVFSSIFVILIQKSRFIIVYKISKNIVFNFLLLLLLLCLIVVLSYFIIDLKEGIYNISILGVIYVIIGYNFIYYSNAKRITPNYYIIVLFSIAIVVLYLLNNEIGVLSLILSVITLTIILNVKYFSNIKIFYLILFLVSILCSYFLSKYNTEIYIFGERLTHTLQNEPIGFYSSLIDDNSTPIGAKISDLNLNLFVTILLYMFLVSVGVGILFLQRKSFGININGVTINDKIWRIIYISLYAVIIIAVFFNRIFLNNLEDKLLNIHIQEMSSTITVDYNNKDVGISQWLKSISNIYGVDIDIYSSNGYLKTNSRESDSEVSDIVRPKILCSNLLKEIYNNKKSNFIVRENYYGRARHRAVYVLTTDSIILRIPYNHKYITTKHLPMLMGSINIFVAILSLFIICLALIYYNQIKPLKFLKTNLRTIRSRNKIKIPLTLEKSYEVGNVLNEYNIIIKELSERHSLQMVLERQILYNRIMRMVAHEIKNPLTPMLLMSQLALRQLKERDENSQKTVVRTLSMVIEQTNKISDLISKMMKDSENMAADSSDCAVLPILEEIIQFYSVYDFAIITLENNSPEIKPQPKINARDFWSIVSNITTNALDAIKAGGCSDGKILYRLKCEEGIMTLKISNNGIPIPAYDINSIFNYSFTTKSDGHGVGLFLAHQIVKFAEGELSVGLSNEQYTEFVIKLPIINKKVTD